MTVYKRTVINVSIRQGETAVQRAAKEIVDNRPTMVNTLRKVDTGDAKAQEVVSKWKPGIADAMRNELKRRETAQPVQQNTQPTPQNNAERGVGGSAPISQNGQNLSNTNQEQTNQQQPQQASAQKQPSEAAKGSQDKPVTQYTSQPAEGQGEAQRPRSRL